jgi:type II secretory pathway component PulM
MQTPPSHDEGPEEKRQIFGMHIGDLGLVLIAFLCTVTLFLILFSPSPADRLQKAQGRLANEKARQEQAIRQKKIDAAVATGEVSVGILPPKKH